MLVSDPTGPGFQFKVISSEIHGKAALEQVFLKVFFQFFLLIIIPPAFHAHL
jgi:hypothetical protein